MADEYKEWIPVGVLEPYVARIWTWDGPVPDAKAMRFLPSGAAQIFLSFSDIPFESRKAQCSLWQTLSPVVFIGPQFSYFDMSIAPMAKMAGVIFKPGGTLPFFEHRTSLLVDQLVPLDTVWNAGGVPDFRSSSVCGAIPVLADWLVSGLRHGQRGDRVLGEITGGIVHWDGKVSRVDALSSRFHISTKRLSRVFHEVFGVRPKRFARVRRFNLALKEIFERKNAVLVDVADEIGCFDQPHLNREFRLFSGISPAQYLTFASTLYYFPLLNEPA